VARRGAGGHVPAAARTAIEHAIECGRLLVEAKASVPHGEWLPWLRENTEVSERTARRWMRFAENSETLLAKSATVAELIFAEAEQLLGAPPPDECEQTSKAQKGEWTLPENATGYVREVARYRGVLTSDSSSLRVAPPVGEEDAEAVIVEPTQDRSVGDVVSEPVGKFHSKTVDQSVALMAETAFELLKRYLMAARKSVPDLPSMKVAQAMPQKHRDDLRRRAERLHSWAGNFAPTA
jgi:DUF3102 family protein